jgi:predicted nuclease with TOPRIM domain
MPWPAHDHRGARTAIDDGIVVVPRVAEGAEMTDEQMRHETTNEREFQAIQETFVEVRTALVSHVTEQIGALRTEMNDRFARMDDRFTRIDERLTRIDERFTRIDERFTGIDERFSRMDGRFDRMERRFDRFEDKLDRALALRPRAAPRRRGGK